MPPPSRRSAPRRSSSARRSEEHTSELQSLMRISYAVFCLKKKKKKTKSLKINQTENKTIHQPKYKHNTHTYDYRDKNTTPYTVHKYHYTTIHKTNDFYNNQRSYRIHQQLINTIKVV